MTMIQQWPPFLFVAIPVNQQVKMTTQQQVKLTTSKHEKKVFIYPKIMSAFEVGEGADAHPRFPFIAS